MLTVGLVVEGTHDYIMLDPFIRYELSRRNHHSVKLRFLQPLPDQTGSNNDGGWSRVVAWCKDNSGQKLETFFTPLFDGDPSCDAIVIHLDGDALEQIGPHTSINIPKKSFDVTERVSLLTDIIEDLLDAAAGRRSAIALALPVLQTEAWLLAAEGTVNNPEVINAKKEFRKTYNVRAGGMAQKYASRARAIKAHPAAHSCVSFQAFVREIDNLTI